MFVLYFQNQKIMFGLFGGNKIKKKEKEYKQLMEEAMHVQRSGDLRKYADMIGKAEELEKEIEALKQEKS